jgi:putative aminopeptidase FrvX
MQDLEFLKEVLSVPTVSYKEDKMVEYIVKWLKDNNIDHYVDEHMNVYATKQEADVSDDFMFPCVVSHTDTVHNLDTINIREMSLRDSQKKFKLALKAFNDEGYSTGIGGDDKCGIFACLTLLKELPYLKAAFFVSEEVGCVGSRKAQVKFFENVGYAIQFDAPENWMITETCFGTRLFERGSDFFNICDKILTENMCEKRMYMKHPYTDVWALKNLFTFSCINISIGYYDYHSRNEYVVVDDVYNGIEIGRKFISELGYKKYYYECVKESF